MLQIIQIDLKKLKRIAINVSENKLIKEKNSTNSKFKNSIDIKQMKVILLYTVQIMRKIKAEERIHRKVIKGKRIIPHLLVNTENKEYIKQMTTNADAEENNNLLTYEET